jgi:hypothetical protein
MTDIACASCGVTEDEAVAEDLGWQRTAWCVPTVWACPVCVKNGTGVASEPRTKEEGDG